jgi:hypothetical protein
VTAFSVEVDLGPELGFRYVEQSLEDDATGRIAEGNEEVVRCDSHGRIMRTGYESSRLDCL